MSPSVLEGLPTVRGSSFESLMLTKYFSATCDPINPKKHIAAYLLATVVSPGILISPERLAALLASRFGGRPSAYAAKQLAARIFEFKVASSDVASEIALRGWLVSGCIMISLCLKQRGEEAFSAHPSHEASFASKNAAQRRQGNPAKIAFQAQDSSKRKSASVTALLTARSRYLPNSAEIACRYATNQQRPEDLALPEKWSWRAKFPQHACSRTNSRQTTESSSDTVLQRLHANSDILQRSSLSDVTLQQPTDLAPYKTALLFGAANPPRPKLTYRVFPKKPKDLHRRCFRCLSFSHFIASCRDPVVCWLCRSTGHYKRNCPFAFQLDKQSKVSSLQVLSMEPTILGCPKDNPSFTPPPPPLPPRHPPTHLGLRRFNGSPAAPSSGSSRNAPGHESSPSSIASSRSPKTISEAAASLFLMGDRARRILQQNANPSLFDLLAFLSQTTKLELEGYPGHTPHALVTFERGAYHIRLELSPCRVVETWILVARVDCLDEPTFPCYNIQAGSISRECYRSLLFSLLPSSEDGPVLALLPAVDCHFKVKPVTHSLPLAPEVASLSLVPLSQEPALLPHTSFQTVISQLIRIVMPSPPICTLPPLMLPPITKLLAFPPQRSSVAVVPLETVHCTRLGLPTPQLLEAVVGDNADKNDDDKTSACEPDLPSPKTPKLLQLLAPRKRSEDFIPDLNGNIPDLNVTPLDQDCRSKEIDFQVYVRRSPRLRKAYDGARVTPVERASRRVAMAAPSSSTSSTSAAGDRRKSRPKTKKIGEIIQLPLKARPEPTSKAMIRELANLCGLKAKQTFEEATKLEKAALGGAPSNA